MSARDRILAAIRAARPAPLLPAEAIAPLKLLEKGVSKEALAGLILIEFPMELASALVAGRWASASRGACACSLRTTPWSPSMRRTPLFWVRLSD